MNLLLLVLSLFSGANAVSWAAESCAIQSQSLVKSMSPIRKQDGTSLCYAFAATAALQQYYCSEREKRGEGACQYGFDPKALAQARTDRELDQLIQRTRDDRLSVLDITATSNYGEERGGGILGGGDSMQVFQKVAQRGEVALEKCALFDRVVNSMPPAGGQQVETYRGIQSYYWNRTLRELFEGYKDPNRKCPCQDGRQSRAQYYAEEIKKVLDLQTDTRQIEDALNQKFYGMFLKGVLIPKGCENSRIKIPRYQVKNLSVPRAPKASQEQLQTIEAGLDSLFKRQEPIPGVATLCAFQVSKQSLPETARDCGYHALVVSGVREQCCGKTCSKEYRIYDSDDTFGKNRSGEEIWVKREDLLDRMVRAVNNPDAGPYPKAMTWIESPEGERK